jgi:membrane associated rhomboid family serine protease
MRFIAGLDRTSSAPVVMVPLLLSVNVALYCWLFFQSQDPNISVSMLFRYGAMYSDALDRGEYWRLITAGFLHANPLHILGNMLCLIIWGGPLEKRLGGFYFTCIYGVGLVAGALASDIAHAGTPFLSVGASGAISAVLGALLALQLLGRIRLPWSFFVINISLNIALAVGVTRIDWGAHLGGFLAGMLACACLDLLERAFARLLRCKFPEFAKVNSALAAAMVAAYCWTKWSAAIAEQNIWLLLLAAIGVGFLVIKLLDLILSMKKGLAVVVLAFAIVNAALVWLWSDGLAKLLVWLCTGQFARSNAIAAAVCADVGRSVLLAAVIVLALTMLLYWRVFTRGMADVGFVAGALQAERNRHQGL